MADVQVTAASFRDGVLTVTGAGFTRTTTQVFVDGRQVTFEVTDEGRLTITGVDLGGGAAKVWAIKGDIESEHVPIERTEEAAETEPYDPSGDVHEEGYKTADPNVTPGDVVEDDLKTTSDVDPQQLDDLDLMRSAAPPEPNREAYGDTEHLDHDFRFRVENTAVVTMDKLGIGPRDPYPEGNPPDPEEQFKELHGYPRPPADDGQAPQPGV